MKKLSRIIDYNAPIQIKILSYEQTHDTRKGNGMKYEEVLTDIPKNLMDKQELHEKHLQNAIKHNSSIPVPDIVEIDKDDYDRLYPENYSAPKVRIMIQPRDDEVEYDIDSEDDEWLKENGQVLKLENDDFEKFMDYLERTANGTKKVPTVNEILEHFKKYKSLLAVEATYDYWLNKRLKSNGKAILYSLKKEKLKIGLKTKYDPYVAFRPCKKRMHLRKNRARDYENYVKMLDIRDKIKDCLKFYKKNALGEQVKHEHLKLRFETFQDQYQTERFNSSYLEKDALANTEFMLRDFRENRIGYDLHENESEDKMIDPKNATMEVDENVNEMYQFSRNPDCQFHEIRNEYFDPNFVPENDVTDTFYSTDGGVMRKRLGRGGRIIYDRKRTIDSSDKEPEYQEVDFCKTVHVRRCNSRSSSLSQRSSPFQLEPSICEPNFDLNDMEIVGSFE